MPAVTKHEAGTVCWVDLMAWDLEKAKTFYGGLFGWTFETGGQETNYYTMARSQGREVAALMQRAKDAPFPPVWNLYFSVESVDRSLARVKELGGRELLAPMDVMDAGRMAFCQDSTGVPFGLWQPNQFQGAGVVNEPGSMAWNEVKTRDGAKALDFYKGLFGFTAEKMQTEEMDYWVMKKNGKEVGGLMKMTARDPADLPPHCVTTFSVANTDEAAATVTRLGGKVLVAPFDSPYGRISIVADPGGASFGIIKLSEMGAA
ncbi:VOC family protein [Corallococcus praedator]|uniref:VOC family protein n=1 Tax=Corallococcus praedator TaxID=2316724 RepID=A0ABX9QHU9_9BACT|nr:MULTISPECIES: VOC family protein [Corallococcus]RKH08084.1 VOC family protein [Corallococcus sp. CA047B]RKH32340.1 VOC family protein [Corallococcus sp. CA031C]RKI07731.1 VOC family protein [Corallococcus praedator]